VTQLGDKQFRLALEDCLAFGKPMLIENIEEELDPVLDPVLERRLVRGGLVWEPDLQGLLRVFIGMKSDAYWSAV